MHRLIKNYWSDLNESGHLDKTLQEFYEFVKKIPYKEDPLWTEVLSRPKFSLNQYIIPALDCKKKAILISSWLYAHGIPYRLIAISEMQDAQIHHVFAQGYFKNEGWKNIDPTYPEFQLFEPKYATAGEQI